ncbi:hypothetical protein F0726_00605 [Acidithiobacillus caldus]|nr:hypothetical protein F0726_00605 [Acidithiobacillus caldus]
MAKGHGFVVPKGNVNFFLLYLRYWPLYIRWWMQFRRSIGLIS